MCPLPGHLEELKAVMVDDSEMKRDIPGRQLNPYEVKANCLADGFAAAAELRRRARRAGKAETGWRVGARLRNVR